MTFFFLIYLCILALSTVPDTLLLFSGEAISDSYQLHGL